MKVIGLLLLCLAAYGQNYPYVISTIAGSYPMGDGGPAVSALLEFPNSIAVARNGDLYIADTLNNRIRKVTSDGKITTFTETADSPLAIRLDSSGNVWYTDHAGIYKIAPDGAESTVAGGDKTGFGGDGGPARRAFLHDPSGLAFDSAGNVYVADKENHRVRKIGVDGNISTIAGGNTPGSSGDNGPATSALLAYPNSLAIDATGNLYIAVDYRVRKVSPSGTITTVAGNGYCCYLMEDGPGINNHLGWNISLALDANGGLLLVDPLWGMVARLAADGSMRRIAGNLDVYGFSGDGGAALNAVFAWPTDAAADASGVYICDSENQRVRKIVQDGTVATIAGRTHFGGDGGKASDALLHRPDGVALDGAGNLYIADSRNHRVRKIGADGNIRTLAGSGNPGFGGDNGQAASADLYLPSAVALDAAGNVYISDNLNHRVRKVTPDGVITTVTGSGTAGDQGDGSYAVSARLRSPYGLAVDSSGNLYIADEGAHRVRKVTPDGLISTVAGTGTEGYSGDGALATAAQLSAPQHLAIDRAGNLYIADLGNARIRKISANGIIGTVTDQMIPLGLGLDAAGNLFATDLLNKIVRVGSTGALTTIAGGAGFGFSGDGGVATSAAIDGPFGIAVDSSGDIFFADHFNSRIRKLMLNSPVKLEIAAGDKQTGPVGQALANPLRVKITGRSGAGVAGVPVSFTVTGGTARLSAPTANTDAAGIAGVAVTFGNAEGAVEVTASGAGLQAVKFALTVTAAPPPAVSGPKISAGGVVGGAFSVPAVKRISPRGFLAIFGERFTTGASKRAGTEDFANGRLPLKLAGACVTVDGEMAPLYYAGPTQMVLVAPAVALNTQVPVVVISNCGETSEIKSAPEMVQSAPAAPEFFYAEANQDGHNHVAAINAAGGYVTKGTPAKPGEVVAIYGTGFGETDPAVTPGDLNNPFGRTILPAKVLLGGVELEDGAVFYAGNAPQIPGVYQLNIRIPESQPDGDHQLVLNVGGVQSPSGAYISVKK